MLGGNFKIWGMSWLGKVTELYHRLHGESCQIPMKCLLVFLDYE